MAQIKEKEYKTNFDLNLWKRYLSFLKPYKKSLIMLIIIMVFVGAIDATFPYLSKYAIDNFVVKGTYENFYKFIMFYAFLIVFQTVNVYYLIAIAGKIDMGLCHDIRKSAFERLQSLSFSFFDTTQTGYLMARLTSDVSKLGDTLAWGIVDMVWGFSIMSFILFYLLSLNARLALYIILAIPVLFVISIYFQKRILSQYRKVRKLNSQITGSFNEGIMGAKTTKVLSTEDMHIGEFKNETGEMKKAAIRAAVLSSIYMPIVISLGSISTAFILVMGGKQVYLNMISYGTLVAFISYSIQFFEPVRELARVMAELISAQAAAERVIDLIETKPEIIDYSDDDSLKINGDVVFENVSFKYKEGEKVLENFNLNVKKGQSIALVGETGSGKSTIVNLVCRFYEPTEGTIYIDGVDYRKIPLKVLHSSLGYVLQTPHLFSGTVADNIRYGKLDATMEEIIEAAKLVNAHEFIMGLEKGYDTEVGEGGSKLSIGQRQLISLARAVISNPSIFILDEATSSVDAHTEHMIQDAINNVLKGRTSFIIAHRLSTIVSADRILVIDDGKILEEGSHKELLRKKGHYYSLYKNMLMSDIHLIS
ncbi:putative ABC transporter ATP-binding protein [Caloramator mitchellensis]|uniref:Putative ABC transporter ATP-binding protein n=1 Tax=Caloramator mitchellensis TaxID=908809 RepID=A0A0R3JZ64_CALMK|nr:ABC transporter ATP-binding protein [Caloramator mitchellensis]KRQ86252.1 putative ABC transporter ATP-binding protein [Caloramator mitchellensis]